MFLKTLRELDDTGLVGDWCFVDTPSGIEFFFRYPRKEWLGDLPENESRGDVVRIPVSIGEHTIGRWGWNGSYECPTITPSVNVIGIWHGFFQNGKVITA